MESKNNYKAWLYLAPVLILLGLFTFYPLINTFLISFMKDYDYSTGQFTEFTLDNYGIILHLKDYPDWLPNGKNATAFLDYALPNTMFIAFVTVPISIIISLGIAVLINSIKVFKKFFQTLFFMPYVTNVIAVGMVFSVIFADHGLFNAILGIKGTPWVSFSPELTWGHAMFALCMQIIWYECPYKILIFLSGLQGIDQQYYDSAKVDNAGKWKTLTTVTIPLLSPQIFYITITSFIGAFKEYQAVKGLFNRPGTSGNSLNLYTCVYYIYDVIKKPTIPITYACAAAVVLFLIIMAFTALQLWIGKKRVHY